MATKRKVPATEPPEMKTYIMECFDGSRRRVTVPASWKVTFGPLVVGKRDDQKFDGNGRASTLALRFYESDQHQRAIFTDVKTFRDASIHIEERVTKSQRKTVRRTTPDGVQDFEVEAKATRWRNPDQDVEADDRLLELPEGDLEF